MTAQGGSGGLFLFPLQSCESLHVNRNESDPLGALQGFFWAQIPEIKRFRLCLRSRCRLVEIKKSVIFSQKMKTVFTWTQRLRFKPKGLWRLLDCCSAQVFPVTLAHYNRAQVEVGGQQSAPADLSHVWAPAAPLQEAAHAACTGAMGPELKGQHLVSPGQQQELMTCFSSWELFLFSQLSVMLMWSSVPRCWSQSGQEPAE